MDTRIQWTPEFLTIDIWHRIVTQIKSSHVQFTHPLFVIPILFGLRIRNRLVTRTPCAQTSFASRPQNWNQVAAIWIGFQMFFQHHRIRICLLLKFSLRQWSATSGKVDWDKRICRLSLLARGQLWKETKAGRWARLAFTEYSTLGVPIDRHR